MSGKINRGETNMNKLQQALDNLERNQGNILDTKTMAQTALTLIQSLTPRQFELLKSLLVNAEATHDDA